MSGAGKDAVQSWKIIPKAGGVLSVECNRINGIVRRGEALTDAAKVKRSRTSGRRVCGSGGRLIGDEVNGISNYWISRRALPVLISRKKFVNDRSLPVSEKGDGGCQY